MLFANRYSSVFWTEVRGSFFRTGKLSAISCSVRFCSYRVFCCCDLASSCSCAYSVWLCVSVSDTSQTLHSQKQPLCVFITTYLLYSLIRLIYRVLYVPCVLVTTYLLYA